MSRSVRHTAGLVALALSLVLFAAPAAWAAPTPSVDIHSAGPLSDIYIGNDLSCQVRSGGFSSTEFYPNAAGPADCGTFLFLNSDNASGGLFGPDFANHAAGTETSFSQGEMPFTPSSQSFTGVGTAANPYRVTTTVGLTSPTGNIPVTLQLTEVDSYVVGDDFYETDVTVTNVGTVTPDNGGELYRAADCQLRGSNTGFGVGEPASSPVTGACTTQATAPTALEEILPITAANSWSENAITAIWPQLNGNVNGGVLSSSALGRNVNNGQAVEWSVPALAQNQSATFQMKTKIVDTVPSGVSFSGLAGSTVGGTVATITDPNTSATASAYSATINWGDGSSSAGTITGGNGTFNVAGSHAYAAGGSYPVAVTITSVGTSQGSSTVNDTAAITAAPTPVVTGAPSIGITSAGFTGSVNPDGLPTTASFQYALDPKYTGGGPIVYSKSTPPQSVGSDFTTHTVSTSVTGLVPNAVYHVRLVATNSAGTSFGPNVAFTTHKAPPPGAPALGKTFNISPVSGFVLIKLHGVFVPLTELSQIPANTLINALHGTLKLTTAGGSSGPAHDAAAKVKKRKKVKTQSGNFGGAVFKISQAHNGLATLSLVDGAVKGAPGYGTCNAKKAADVIATAARSRTLQLLRASAHGRFRTRGRYSAATVRGTKWTVADRCDGTLTQDITDSVAVTDFVRHKTIVLHARQSYLAKPHKRK